MAGGLTPFKTPTALQGYTKRAQPPNTHTPSPAAQPRRSRGPRCLGRDREPPAAPRGTAPPPPLAPAGPGGPGLRGRHRSPGSRPSAPAHRCPAPHFRHCRRPGRVTPSCRGHVTGGGSPSARRGLRRGRAGGAEGGGCALMVCGERGTRAVVGVVVE